MFHTLFTELRSAKLPVSLKEYLTLLEALEREVIPPFVDDFYHLSRAALIKDERHIDRFDKVFAKVFRGIENISPELAAEIPREWLELLNQKFLSDEEKAQIDAMGGFDKLMETLQKRLEEQKERHQGGNKWIGTGGTSPYGNGGYNPEGVRIGGKPQHGRAVKVWEKREYKNLDDSVELGTRNIKIAMRRLRKWARTGAPTELDLGGTIEKIARDGYSDVVMRPERHNNVKIVLFFDIGGSMDGHIKVCEELFSAAKAEFKHLDFYYFHNCLYESVWKDNRRRQAEKIDTFDVLNKYGNDYKIIFVGDASMSPYEITHSGGSVEHWNEEAGGVWLKRVVEKFPHFIWINPIGQQHWHYSQSTQIIGQLIGEHRMFEMTLDGLDKAMKELSR